MFTKEEINVLREDDEQAMKKVLEDNVYAPELLTRVLLYDVYEMLLNLCEGGKQGNEEEV